MVFGWLRKLRITVQAHGPGAQASLISYRSSTAINYSIAASGERLFPGLTVSVDQATTERLHNLRQTIGAQLSEDIATQELDDPPLRVTWTRASGDSFEQGELAGLAALLAGLPRHRMIILGPAGAGKSTASLMMIRQILRDPAPDVQVPVVFPLGTWRLDVESLRAWMERTLRERYAVAGDEDVAALLTGRRLIIPILDGLDEIAVQNIPRALLGINQSFTADDPFVLTSRVDEFEAGSAAARVRLDTDAVLSLSPVGIDDALAFITAKTGPEEQAAWRDAVRELERTPGIEILRRPLTIWLLRAVFRSGRLDPADLLDQQRFPLPASVERFLVQAMIPALLARAVRTAPGFRRAYRRMPSARRARKVLTLLAVGMSNQGSRTFSWWELPAFMPPWDERRLGLWVILGPLVLLGAFLAALRSLGTLGMFDVVCACVGLGGTLWGFYLYRQQIAEGQTSVLDVFYDRAPWQGIGGIPKPQPQALATDVRRSIRYERRRVLARNFVWTAIGICTCGSWAVPAAVSIWLAIPVTLLAIVVGNAVWGLVKIGNYGRPYVWTPYAITKLWWVAQGRLPIRFTRWLEQMRYAGLLRHAGSQVEFRSIEVQNALAAHAGPRIRRWFDPIPPLVLPGAAAYHHFDRAEREPLTAAVDLDRPTFAQVLADAAAILAYGSNDAAAPAGMPQPGQVAATRAVLPPDPIWPTAEQQLVLRIEGSSASEAVEAWDQLIEVLRTKHGTRSLAVGRAVFRQCLTLIDQVCIENEDDMTEAIQAIDHKLNAVLFDTEANRGDFHPETQTIRFVYQTFRSWHFERNNKIWRRRIFRQR